MIGSDGSSTTLLPSTPSSAGIAPKGDWRARLPFFYGWLVVAGAFVSMGLGFTVWYSFSVFYVALLEDFGWDRAPAAGVFSLFVIVWSIAGIGAGALVDRLGPQRVVAVGVTILAAGLAASSRITELWQFYLLFGVVVAVGFSLSSWIPAIAMISRWFSARLGTALGIASAGVGTGILVMVPLSQWIITQMGWRNAYLALAAIIFLGIMPTALLVLRGKPEDLGLVRDGRVAQDQTRGASAGGDAKRRSRIVDPDWANRDWTVRSAMGTRRFWVLFAMLALNSFGNQVIFVHQVAFLVDGGYEKQMIASVVGLVGMFSIGAKIGWGSLSDRIGRELTYTLGVACLLVAVGLLSLTRFVSFGPLVYLFSFAFAFGYAVGVLVGPAAGADLFAGRRFGSIYGTLGLSNGFGAAFGAWFAGYVFDVTGGYLPAFACAAGLSFLSAIAMWIAAPRKVRRVPGRC